MDLLKDWRPKFRIEKSRQLEGEARTLVDVGGVSLLPGLSPLLLGLAVSSSGGLCGLLGLGLRGGFGGSLGGSRGRGLSGGGSWLSWHL